ncbi:MAG: tRNA dihydrouridine synthase DusB [Lachnospiraceae bacterium]
MKIGNVELKSKVVLGPMAGFTDMPFRALCAEQGACLTYTEMISAKGLYYNNRDSFRLTAVSEKENAVALQLFGSEPELMAGEAVKLEDGPFDIFDVNIGCPMPKIVNNGEGSALMKNPLLVGRIVEAMANAVSKPVTVKIRKGFSKESVNAVEVARVAREAGAAAITVHGRTREEYYSGKADWDIIKRVKDAVDIPVIGNGDVTGGPEAARMMEETGCDGVMVARAARGNPWIFREINAYLESGERLPRPGKLKVAEMLRRHLGMMVNFAGGESGVRQMRKHAGYYCMGFSGATWLRREINKAESAEDFERILTIWQSMV